MIITFFLLIALFLLIFMVSLWMTIVIVLEDHNVPVRSKIPFKNVLVIYPHPDDECLSCGGLIHMLSGRGAITTLLTLTKGECGTPDASLKELLKSTRAKELTRSAKVLGFSQVILDDLGDGTLSEKKAVVTKTVREVLERIDPDLVISYDRAGMYGHPDHILLADVVTRLCAETKTILWYTVLPQSMRAIVKLPTQMAKDPAWAALQEKPTHKVCIGHHVIAKIRSLMCHTSQLPGFKKAFLSFMPLWFPHSTRLFEYYAQVK